MSSVINFLINLYLILQTQNILFQKIYLEKWTSPPKKAKFLFNDARSVGTGAPLAAMWHSELFCSVKCAGPNWGLEVRWDRPLASPMRQRQRATGRV